MYKKLLTIAEVSNRLNVSLRTARRMTANGTLPVVRFGRCVRVEEQALNDWIDAGGKVLDGHREQTLAN